MTEDERTVWRCIWRQIASRNAAVVEAYLREDLHKVGMQSDRVEAELQQLQHSGHVIAGLEVGTFELKESGWRLMARALSGSGVKVQSKVVPFRSRR